MTTILLESRECKLICLFGKKALTSHYLAWFSFKRLFSKTATLHSVDKVIVILINTVKQKENNSKKLKLRR